MSDAGFSPEVTEQERVQNFYERAAEVQAVLDERHRTEPGYVLEQDERREMWAPLDELCPFREQPVWIGRSNIPITYVDLDTGVKFSVIAGEEADLVGTHQGVNIMPTILNGLVRYQVVHQVAGVAMRPATAGLETCNFVAWAGLESEVIPALAIDRHVPEQEADVEPVLDLARLQTVSDNFRDMMLSAEFQQLEAAEQQKAIDSFMYQVVEHPITERQIIEAHPQFVYVSDAQKRFRQYEICDQLPVNGHCVAISTLESPTEQVIRSQNDMLAPEAGLCWVILASPDTAKLLSLEPDTPMFIPMSGQEYMVSVLTPELYESLQGQPMEQTDMAMLDAQKAARTFDQVYQQFEGRLDLPHVMDQVKAALIEINQNCPYRASTIRVTSDRHMLDRTFGVASANPDMELEETGCYEGTLIGYVAAPYYEDEEPGQPRPVLATHIETTIASADGQPMVVQVITPIMSSQIELL